MDILGNTKSPHGVRFLNRLRWRAALGECPLGSSYPKHEVWRVDAERRTNMLAARTWLTVAEPADELASYRLMTVLGLFVCARVRV